MVTFQSLGCRVFFDPPVVLVHQHVVVVRAPGWTAQPPGEPGQEPNGHSTARLPEYFYRVQHNGSDIIEHTDGSFEARSRYWMNNCQCDDDGVPHRHLDFFEDAVSLAWAHILRRRSGIHSSKIETKTLRPQHLEIRFGDTTVRLPVWVGEGGCTFLSFSDVRKYLGATEDDGVMRDVRRYLGDREREGVDSEWFALDFIPAELVRPDKVWGSLSALNQAARDIKRAEKLAGAS